MNKNPLTFNQTIAFNGDQPLSDEAEGAVYDLIDAMNGLTNDQRLTIYTILGDFFCPRCGIEQPEGDCQCDGQ